jgi:uncharacterized protein YegL
VLGPDDIIADSCRITSGQVTVRKYPSEFRGSEICEIQRRRANATAGLYYALAQHGPGCWQDFAEKEPVLLRFTNERFDIVEEMFPITRGNRSEAGSEPRRLSAAADGTLYLGDAGLRRLDADGKLIEQLPVALYPSDPDTATFDTALAVGDGQLGRVALVGVRTTNQPVRPQQFAVLYGDTEVRRHCRARRCSEQPYLRPQWRHNLPANTDAVLAIAHEPTRNLLVVLRLEQVGPHRADRGIEIIAHKLTVLDLGVGPASATTWDLPGDDREALWADVEAGPDGRIYVLDTLGNRARVLSPDGTLLGDVRTPADAFRVAGGPRGELFLLTAGGQVVRLAPDGTELSRFDGRPHGGVNPTALVDLAVDAAGRVFTVDATARQVTLFEPSGSEDDALVGERCTVSANKWAAPRDLVLGDTTTITMRVTGTCGLAEDPTDLVLSVNTNAYSLGDDPGRVFADNLRVARQIAALVDTDRHRLGVVVYAATGAVNSVLTNDTETIIQALMNGFAGNGVPRDYAGLRTARDVFAAGSPRRRVVVLVGPAGDDESVNLAGQIKAEGTLIIAVNGDSPVASSDVYSGLTVSPRGAGAARVAYQWLQRRRHPPLLVQSGTLTDQLPGNMEYVDGSASPAAVWDPVARTLRWDASKLTYVPADFTLTVRPRQAGDWPTNVEAMLDFVDGWNGTGRAVLPVPRVRVYVDAIPTATAPPTPSPTPTSTRATLEPQPLYLPWLSRYFCRRVTLDSDIALVVDTSLSMSDSTQSGGPTKLQAAVAATQAFLAQVRMPEDRVALVQFNVDATVLVPLTGDRAAIVNGLRALTHGGGTRIDRGLRAGAASLSQPTPDPSRRSVLVLLTDGAPSGVTPEEVIQTADEVRASGVQVYAIGLGSDVDAALLRRLAFVDGRYYPAPDASDLETIYRTIAAAIPCDEG